MSQKPRIRKPVNNPTGWSFNEVSRNVHLIKINFDKDYKEQKILLQSDVHWDNPKTDWDLLKKHLDEAKKFNAPVIDAGDWFCAMQGKYDPRGTKSDVRPEHNNIKYLDSLVETSAKFLEPYKDILTIRGQGNHETSILKRHETNITERLVERLKAKGSNCKLGGYSGWVRIQVQIYNAQESFRLWYHHGWGGGGPVTKGTIQTARIAAYVDADICLTGHTHDSWIMPLERIKLNNSNNIVKYRQVHVRTPGYKEEYADGFGGWHIERGGPPKSLGAAWLTIKANPARTSFDFEITEAR
jgi:hypothetical protein